MFLRNAEAERCSRNIGIKIRKQKWLQTIENTFQRSSKPDEKKVFVVQKQKIITV